MASPGTSSRAGGLIHFPSRFTRALTASFAFSASMALPAWRSSQNPTTALAKSSSRMMPKSGQCRATARQNHGRFDHPGNRAPKIGKELQERIGFLFFDLVRPILGQTFLRLGLGEAIRRRSSFFSTLTRGKDFKSSSESGFVVVSGPSSLGLRDFESMARMPSIFSNVNARVSGDR